MKKVAKKAAKKAVKKSKSKKEVAKQAIDREVTVTVNEQPIPPDQEPSPEEEINFIQKNINSESDSELACIISKGFEYPVILDKYIGSTPIKINGKEIYLSDLIPIIKQSVFDKFRDKYREFKTNKFYAELKSK